MQGLVLEVKEVGNQDEDKFVPTFMEHTLNSSPRLSMTDLKTVFFISAHIKNIAFTYLGISLK